MEYIISGIVFIGIFVSLFPYDLLRKKRKYRQDAKLEKKAGTSYGNKSLQTLVDLSTNLRRIIKPKLSNRRYEKLENSIKYAGLQNQLTPLDFVGLKYLATVVTFLFFLIILISEFSTINIVLALAAMILGYMAPDNWLAMKGKNRQWAIQKDMPSLLSSMAVITDAGYNLIQSIEVVVEQNDGELAEELLRVLEDIKIGIPVKDAFINLSQRSNVDELSYFVSAIVQGLEKGAAGITKVIKEQAQESWEKRKHKAKELAEKASMKLFLPLLFLVFPAYMIFLLGPMVFSVIQLFKGGIL